jgi:hypothetical protein
MKRGDFRLLDEAGDATRLLEVGSFVYCFGVLEDGWRRLRSTWSKTRTSGDPKHRRSKERSLSL